MIAFKHGARLNKQGGIKSEKVKRFDRCMWLMWESFKLIGQHLTYKQVCFEIVWKFKDESIDLLDDFFVLDISLYLIDWPLYINMNVKSWHKVQGPCWANMKHVTAWVGLKGDGGWTFKSFNNRSVLRDIIKKIEVDWIKDECVHSVIRL